MTKEKLVLRVIDRSKKEYPNAGCTLNYDRVWKLLVSMRLAAQCTDVRVDVVVEGPYAKHPDVDALAKADAEDIEWIVKPCGLGHSKVKGTNACVKMLKEQYRDKVSDDFDALLEFPGVGGKNVNLIMGDALEKPTTATDTHRIRLVNHMGPVDGIRESKKVEMIPWKLASPEGGNDFCHRLVFHGRDVCAVRIKPRCETCCLNGVCKKAGVEWFLAEME